MKSNFIRYILVLWIALGVAIGGYFFIKKNSVLNQAKDYKLSLSRDESSNQRRNGPSKEYRDYISRSRDMEIYIYITMVSGIVGVILIVGLGNVLRK
ncbi:hypothetical protein HZY62_21900 [Maribacter polysiphoniae]|uniref:Uncharacterized protein n=1 Tax=Maribacter polysiphoniae TaxID=429344 RepID=A0ABR7W513_9FLAO|nr:hypothetical protein [Maribacter polysiphoniae]MBD1263250.1 hypothetical protein [Maribacter polysiphoniae]